MNTTAQPTYQSPTQQAPVHQGIEATVTAFGHVQQSRYSNEAVQSVLFERWDCHDESRKVWKTFPVSEARQFRKDQTVLLRPVRRGQRQSWAVELLTEPEPRPPQPPRPQRAHSKPQLSAVNRPLTHQPNQSAQSVVSASKLSPSHKQEIAAWIAQQADLYAFCFGEAQRALAPREPEEETVRACASSLFISTTRKFRLEA